MCDQIQPISARCQKIVRSWSTSRNISNDLDQFAERIKKLSGLHCDRSKLLNALALLVLEVQDHVDCADVRNAETLKNAIANALKENL